MESNNQVVVSEDLQNILAILKPEDAQQILVLKEELADNWNKKQIFRTETEMRVSVLNDAKHPTPASKYWQAVREMGAHFDAMMSLSFDMRRSEVHRLELEEEMKEAEKEGNRLKMMKIQIDLDQNLYGKACMEQVAHDRVREIQTWSKIKAELNDGSFDDKNVNTHQADALQKILTARVQSLSPTSDSAERINAIGPLNTLNRLKTESNTLLSFNDTKALQEANQ